MASKYFVSLLFFLVAGFVHNGMCQSDSPSSEEDIKENLIPGSEDGEFDIVPNELSSPDPSFAPYAEGDEKDCGPGRKNTDEYVDKILDEVRPKLPQPVSLPGRTGRFRLENGTLSGLPTLTRTGIAMVRCSDESFSFHVPMGLQNMTAAYQWQWDAYFRQFKGGLDLFVRNVEADVLYTRYLTTQSPTPRVAKAQVEKLTITKLEGIRFNFEGLGPLNRIASRFTSLAASVLRSGIARALEGPVKNAINKELLDVEKYEKYY